MTDDVGTLLDGVSELELLRISKALEIRERRLEFAMDHHTNTHGERLEFSNYPHIKDLYNSASPHLVLMGSVQSFKSEFIIVDHFAAAYCGLSVFFVVPKYDMRTTYVQNRVDRVVETVPEYKKIIGSGFFDSVAIKNFGRGVVKYVGSNVQADFKEFPADMIVVDELDECNEQNVEYAFDRLRASKFQFTRYLANPKLPKRGIHAKFLASDQREWNVPCLQCGDYVRLDWFETVVRPIRDKDGNVVDYVLRDTEWFVGCKRDIKCVCPKCGGELERASRKGKWVPENPSSPIEGYHISMLCSLINSVAGMWERFCRAINNPALMQRFFNSDLGLPYNPIGSKVTSALLDKCVEEGYRFVIEENCAHIENDMHFGPCSMGIDVGGVFDVKVSYLESKGVRRCVYIGKVRTVADLLDIVERYNVERAVIDSLPEITQAQDFQDQAMLKDCDVWLCKYASEGESRDKQYNAIDRRISVDRTEALDRSFAALKKRKTVLPENYDMVLNGEFTSEMCLPVREVDEDIEKGKTRFKWSKGKDHARHADTYDMLAANLMMENLLDEVHVG